MVFLNVKNKLSLPLSLSIYICQKEKAKRKYTKWEQCFLVSFSLFILTFSNFLPQQFITFIFLTYEKLSKYFVVLFKMPRIISGVKGGQDGGPGPRVAPRLREQPALGLAASTHTPLRTGLSTFSVPFFT